MTRDEQITEFIDNCEPVKVSTTGVNIFLLRRDALEAILNCAYSAGANKAIADPLGYLAEAEARQREKMGRTAAARDKSSTAARL